MCKIGVILIKIETYNLLWIFDILTPFIIFWQSLSLALFWQFSTVFLHWLGFLKWHFWTFYYTLSIFDNFWQFSRFFKGFCHSLFLPLLNWILASIYRVTVMNQTYISCKIFGPSSIMIIGQKSVKFAWLSWKVKMLKWSWGCFRCIRENWNKCRYKRIIDRSNFRKRLCQNLSSKLSWLKWFDRNWKIRFRCRFELARYRRSLSRSPPCNSGLSPFCSDLFL